MLRSFVAVIVSYFAMFLLVSLAFVGQYAVMGANQAFKPGTFDASNRWIAMSLVSGLVVAVICGLICAIIARGGKAPLALAVVVLVLGFLLAIPDLISRRSTTNTVRTGDVPMSEAMQKAKQPLWVPLVFPLIGAAGVVIGGKLKRRS